MNWIRRVLSRDKKLSKRRLKEGLRDWRIATAETERKGRTAVLRIRMQKPRISGLANYTTAIEITWSNEDGKDMPSQAVHERQLAFERALDTLSCENGFAELVQVSTGLGVKEWLYYTSDQSRFMNELNRFLAGHERYPIKIDFYNDPDWDIWHQTVDAINSRLRNHC